MAGEGLGAPQSYREVIELLGARGIVPPGFVAQVRGMPGFHNILVHDYLAVDLDMVWSMLQEGPAQFREFLKHVAVHVKQASEPPRA